ncbi:MAG: copper resistance protein CopC [Chloroflexota bacterium]
MRLRMAAAFATALLLTTQIGPGHALAHANLLHSNIKNNEILRAGHTPKLITARFAEQLDPGKSWMAVFEGVADHGLVTERTRSKVLFQHPTRMILKLPKLRKERYYLIWYTKSAIDGHYAAGIVYFQVR